MATDPATIEKLLEVGALAGDVTAKKMFGEYGLFMEGKMFAIVGEDQLFIKITDAGREIYPDSAEVSPYPGAKPCFLIPEKRWEEREWLAELIAETVKQLPAPKPKKKKA